MDCSKCIFSVDEDGNQVGCQADRIEKFIAKGKAEKPEGESHYHLHQFCNMYRTEQVGDDSLANAKKQTDVTVGVVVMDDPSLPSESLYKTVESICEAIKAYKDNKVAVVFSVGVNWKGDQVVQLVNEYQAKGIRCQAVVHRYLFDPKVRETEAFQKIASVGWMGIVKSGDTIKRNTFVNINKMINENLEQIVCFKSNKSLFLFSNLVRSQYLNYKSFEDMANDIQDFCSKQDVLGIV